MITKTEIRDEFAGLISMSWFDYCQQAANEIARLDAEDRERSGQLN